MDIYDSRYFIINKKMLISFGLWPYQNREQKLLIRILLTIVMCFMLVPQILRIYFAHGDVDLIIEAVSIIAFTVIVFSKVFTTILNEKKLDVLYSNISRNWEIIQDPEERKILIDYSERGRILTIGYIAYMVSAYIAFDTLALSPTVLNVLRPLNVSRPQIHILGGELFIDRSEHYLETFILDLICTTISTGLMIAFDSMYGASVEHCLGLFAIIKFRLQASTKPVGTDVDLLTKGDTTDAHQPILQTIKLHKNILLFTDVLASTYSSSFLILVSADMMLLSFECVLVLIKSDQIMEVIRFGAVLLGAIVHLFFLSWPGQKLIDHSASLFQDGYNNGWYESSVKSQKLLAFLTLRSKKPCSLTAGGIYEMNFANFAKTVKTSLSYMTLFSSLR